MNNSIYPCIWFDANAKEAADLYTSAFANSSIKSENPIVVIAELSGQKFMLLNGGPKFKPNASMSFFVSCDSHDEVERLYNTLIEGGNALMPLNAYDWSEKYGWIQDKYGVNWQFFYAPTDEFGQKFSPCLMFTGDNAGRAEEAMNFYGEIFANSKIERHSRYENGDDEGKIRHGICRIDGFLLRGMDSSMPHGLKFCEGNSIVVECETQAEIDRFWEKLTEGGFESQCGWLQDKYGVSWQIVPKILGELMGDAERSPRVIAAFMKMKKFDIQALLEA